MLSAKKRGLTLLFVVLLAILVLGLWWRWGAAPLRLRLRLRFAQDPMWSWEFARRCCDVHPVGEFDKQYLQGLQNATASALSVYVKVADFVPFLTWFLAQPSNTRVTVVSGLEDFGPVEIFSPTHARSSRAVAQLCSLQK